MSHYTRNITAPPRMIHQSQRNKHGGFPSMISQLGGTFDLLTVRRISVSPANFDVEFVEDPPVSRRTMAVLEEEEHEGLQYWKVYFDFAYYLLVCPYRFVWNPTSRIYRCHVNRIQKALHYGLFSILCACYLLRLRAMWAQANTYTSPAGHLREPSSSSRHKKNPTEYFDIAVYFFDSTFMLLLFVFFGRRREDVYAVFKELQLHPRKLPPTVSFKRTRLWSTFIMTVCISTVVLKFLEFLHEYNYSADKFLSFKRMESQRLFVFPEVSESFPGFFVFINISSMLYEKILNDFGDILFTLSALLFTNLVSEFSLIMTHHANDMDKRKEGLSEAVLPDEVVEHYYWLREVTGKINTAMQVMNGACIAGNLPFFATTVLEVFGAGTINILERVRYIIACFYFFPSICIAARANKNVEGVKEWICKEVNYTRIPGTKLSVFLHDLSFHTVGISAFGILNVNWNAVGSIISIILTYALLKTQFKAVPDDSNCICNCSFVNQ